MASFIEVFQALAYVAGVFGVVLGLHAWRRDFLGRRRIELAEEVLGLFYQANDAISQIRNPGAFAPESSERKREPEENDEQRSLRDSAFVTIARYKEHSEIFSRIHALRYQFMARFGRETRSTFDTLHGITIEIIVGARQLQRLSVNVGPHDMPANIEKNIDEMQSRIWEGLEGDPIRPKIDAALEQIERITRPILNPPHPWRDRARAMLGRLAARLPWLKFS